MLVEPRATEGQQPTEPVRHRPGSPKGPPDAWPGNLRTACTLGSRFREGRRRAMTDRERDRSLQACSKGHDNLKSARYGTRAGEGVAGRPPVSRGLPLGRLPLFAPFLSQGHRPDGRSWPPRAGSWPRSDFPQNSSVWENRPYRLTATKAPDRLLQLFQTWAFSDAPRLPWSAYPGAPTLEPPVCRQRRFFVPLPTVARRGLSIKRDE